MTAGASPPDEGIVPTGLDLLDLKVALLAGGRCIYQGMTRNVLLDQAHTCRAQRRAIGSANRTAADGAIFQVAPWFYRDRLAV